MNCIATIFEHAARAPEREALLTDAVCLSYRDLASRVEAVAAHLKTCGILPREIPRPRVGLLCPDGPAYIVLGLAVLRAGACLVPIPMELASSEQRRLIDSTASHILLGGPGVEDRLMALGEGRLIRLPEAGVAARVGLQDAGRTDSGFDEASFEEMDPAFVRFTSGTTGQSKAIVISHQRLVERIEAANTVLQIRHEDRVVWVLPMAHHFAVSVLLYLFHGATTVLAESASPQGMLKAAARHGGSVLYAAPWHYARLAAEGSGREMPHLRLAISTTSALTEETAAAFDARFGVPLSQALGLIEVGLAAVNTDVPRRKPTSVGRPTPGFEIELRDESGRAAGVGEIGELFVKGPGMLDGYLSPWQPGKAALAEGGWFRTGDLARRDADGHYFLLGRAHSVIEVSGLKCIPEEIERVLQKHPEVREARVYGRETPSGEAIPAADIVPMDPNCPPSPSVLAKHCRQWLTDAKQPRYFTFVASLPKTPSGKLKRH